MDDKEPLVQPNPAVNPTSIDVNHLIEWAKSFKPLEDCNDDLDSLINAFYLSLPRVRFVKSLPHKSILLEAGAGDGGLIAFRDWLDPIRKDLVFWGTSLESLGRSKDYDIFFEGSLDEVSDRFPGKANSFICCHLIEHLTRPNDLFEWLQGKLETGSPVYIEWPSPETILLPKNFELEVNGVKPMTLNFFDDKTHTHPVSWHELIDCFLVHGYTMIGSGIIATEFYADLLRDIALSSRRNDSEYLYTMALWQKTGFSSYVELRAP
jgi:hypothetical protein